MPDVTNDPVLGDGVLTIPPLPIGETMAMDDTIASQMQQNFANFNQELNRSAVRHQDTAEHVSEESKHIFMLGQQLVGAKAAGQLDRDSLAKSILDARSAAGQPGGA